ncbi:hypothetical protein HYQ46_007936 [Verticillium longisporum]|nr:hypothetical protein HYQ46_007936 [Verticillium longisporum]
MPRVNANFLSSVPCGMASRSSAARAHELAARSLRHSAPRMPTTSVDSMARMKSTMGSRRVRRPQLVWFLSTW